MPVLKYPRLTPQEKMEIIDYWKYHRSSYQTISQFFEKKWKKQVNVHVVSDIILQWKKHNTIRGVRNSSTLHSVLSCAISEALSLMDESGQSLSKNCLYAMCLGEVWNLGLQSVLPMEEFDSILLKSKYLVGDMYTPLKQPEDVSQEVNDLIHSVPPSLVYYLDFFQLFIKYFQFPSRVM